MHHSNALDFLNGGGEMGARMRALNWADTPFGPPEGWPQSLRSALSICLGSSFQIAIYWGPELALLYNDAWSLIPGQKHPWALGRPAREVWPEIWDTIGPMFGRVLADGEATRSHDQLLAMHRRGFLEECYFDYTFSPIRDEASGVGGIFNIAVETTFRVLGERRTRLLNELGARTNQARTAQEACTLAADALSSDPADLPFVLIYLPNPKDTATLDLLGHTGLPAHAPAAPPTVRIDTAVPWPFAEAMTQQARVRVGELEKKLGPGIPGGPWPESCSEAVIVPLPHTGLGDRSGAMIFGLSPRLLFDAEYLAFVERVAAITAAAIANARAYEEERKRAEALAELDRAKTIFFSNVSHEFRTPLTLLLSPIEEILAKPADDVLPENRALLDLAHRSGLRLQRLVNTLLDFSRIEAGRAQASFQKTDLAAVTTDLASSFRSAMQRAGLRFEVDCPELSAPVYVDPEMWEKIVLNLISNAFKYTLRGSVAVRLRERDGFAEMSVEDTGSGIPEAELPRLFERFHRIEGTQSRTHEGTGIGLALVQELVKIHGGTVLVRSAPGKGSVFTVRLPMGAAHLAPERIGASRGSSSTAVHVDAYVEEALRWLPAANEAPPDSPPRLQPSLPGIRSRVLLADDNADMRDYVSRLLEARYEVTSVANGQAALDEARKSPPDLVLTDVMMPVLDGFGLLAALRADERTKTLPILMLSARAGEESRVEGLSAGADDYLVKPFTARELLARVEAHLSLARMRRAADEARRLSEARLGLALEVTGLIAWQWDPTTDTLTARGDLSRIFGQEIRTSSEVIGRLHPEDAPRHRAELDRCAHAGVPYHAELRVLKPASDKVTWVEERGTAVTGADGHSTLVVGVTVDITERKQAEEDMRRNNEELRKLNRELEEFAYVASHDLQEPLRMVNIFSRLLVDQFGSGSERSEQYASFISQGVLRMEALIRDLLVFSRTIRQDEPIGSCADLNAALQEAMSVLQTRIAESGATIEPARLPNTRGETKQLAHVFQNLLSNALKYRKPDAPPHVRIAAMREGDFWTISVEDNGIGFEQQYAARIFGLFKRLHTDEYPGTGLGLAICQRIVERHGGRIWAEGRPGRGAVFHFTLPSAKDQ